MCHPSINADVYLWVCQRWCLKWYESVFVGMKLRECLSLWIVSSLYKVITVIILSVCVSTHRHVNMNFVTSGLENIPTLKKKEATNKARICKAKRGKQNIWRTRCFHVAQQAHPWVAPFLVAQQGLERCFAQIAWAVLANVNSLH